MPIVKRTPELQRSVCEAMASGRSMISWCKLNKIDYSIIADWMDKDASFAAEYARARLMQTDYLAEEILDISDDQAIPADQKRIMVDSRKWYAGKLQSAKYGDKQHLEITGKDGEPLSIRLIEAQQRLLKDITPQTILIEQAKPITPDDII